MTKKGETIKPGPPPTAVAVQELKKEIEPLANPILVRIKSLTVTDAASYALFDSYLAKIRHARAIVKEKFEGKDANGNPTGILSLINATRNAILKMRSELDDPLEEGEEYIRGSMKQFKLNEAREEAEKKRKAELEAQLLRRQAEEKERLAQAAKSKPMQQRLMAQSQELEQKADRVEAAPAVAPVQVRNSGTRTVQKWRVTDIEAFARFVLDGAAPLDCLTVNKETMDQYKKGRPDFKDWPGVELFDDIQIVGR